MRVCVSVCKCVYKCACVREMGGRVFQYVQVGKIEDIERQRVRFVYVYIHKASDTHKHALI